MPNENIGYTPKEAITQGSVPAALPETRKALPEAKTQVESEIKIVDLNPTDIRLSSYPDELFGAIAANMAERGISAEQIPTAL